MAVAAASAEFIRPLVKHDIGPVATEARRSTRLLMAKLHADAAAVLRRYHAAPEGLCRDLALKRGLGQDRTQARLDQHFGAEPLIRQPGSAVWRHVVARDHSMVLKHDQPGAPARGRDVVEVRVICVGKLPGGRCAGEAAWSFSASDHAVGRLFERATRPDPVAAVLAAHDALASLQQAQMGVLLAKKEWAVPVPGGAFLCRCKVVMEPEPSTELAPYFIAHTFVSDDELWLTQERQIAIFDGLHPDYVGGPLCPVMLRKPATLENDA